MTRPIVAVFGSSQTRPADPAWDEARRLGSVLAAAGFDVATGGYGGTMEAVSQGAAGGGAAVIGVTAPSLFPRRSGANRFVTQERPAPTLTARIGDLISISAAAVTLPGSIGTLTELMVAWNELFIRAMSDQPLFPVVAVGSPWDRLVPEIAASLDTDASFVTLASTVDHVTGLLSRRIG
ncbi:MAG: LOG family protein [Acidimicrobiia bacterium]|nr:LOG family protein [Acidimicrobiia bacterium]